MRTPIIAGNWKMNMLCKEADDFFTELLPLVEDVTSVKMVICPVYTILGCVAQKVKDSNIQLGAQNVYWEEKGAFTGEISPPMLKDAGCEYVIIGHSERRQYFGETNETVNKRVKAALAHGLIPIMCCGETLEEREAGDTFDVIKSHILEGLKGVYETGNEEVVIAYEPVWAIGTGKTATPDQAQEVHAYIRKLLQDNFGADIAERTVIQYGGSVKPANVAELMAQPDIDGGLVGGASLKADSFAALVKF